MPNTLRPTRGAEDLFGLLPPHELTNTRPFAAKLVESEGVTGRTSRRGSGERRFPQPAPHLYLTESVDQVGLHGSIPAHIRQPIVYYYLYEKHVDGFVWELTLKKIKNVTAFCEIKMAATTWRISHLPSTPYVTPTQDCRAEQTTGKRTADFAVPARLSVSFQVGLYGRESMGTYRERIDGQVSCAILRGCAIPITVHGLLFTDIRVRWVAELRATFVELCRTGYATARPASLPVLLPSCVLLGQTFYHENVFFEPWMFGIQPR